MNSCDVLDGWGDILWDPRASSTGYGTFAALLAGFSLSGLIWIATSSKDWQTEKQKAAVGILSTLVPLITATLLYAQLSGDQDCRSAYISWSIASWILATGAMALILSLIRLLATFFDQQSDIFAELIALTAIASGTLAVAVGNGLLRQAYTGDNWVSSTHGIAQLALLAGAFVLSLWMYLLGQARDIKGVPVYAVVVAAGALAFSVLFAWAQLEDSDWMSTVVLWARTIGWAAFLLAAGALGRLRV